MLLNRRSLQLSLLVSALLGLGGYAVVKGQQKPAVPATAKRWSDANTWPDKKVPAKDALVTRKFPIASQTSTISVISAANQRSHFSRNNLRGSLTFHP